LEKTAAVMNTIDIMEENAGADREVTAEIVSAAGTGIIACTRGGTTTVVADAGVTNITEIWVLADIL